MENPYAEAACLRPGVDPDLFFPVEGAGANANTVRSRAARLVCSTCPVRERCLIDYLDLPDGVVGGLTANDRIDLRGELGYQPGRGTTPSSVRTVARRRLAQRFGQLPRTA